KGSPSHQGSRRPLGRDPNDLGIEAIEVSTGTSGAASWEVAEAKMVLGRCRWELENSPSAKEQLRASIEILKRLGPSVPRTVFALEELKRLSDSWNESGH